MSSRLHEAAGERSHRHPAGDHRRVRVRARVRGDKPGMDPAVWRVIVIIVLCYVVAFWLLFKM